MTGPRLYLNKDGVAFAVFEGEILCVDRATYEQDVRSARMEMLGSDAARNEEVEALGSVERLGRLLAQAPYSFSVPGLRRRSVGVSADSN